MSISFRQYLLKEFRSNKPKVDSFDIQTLHSWVKEAKLLRFILGVFDKDKVNSEKSVTVYEYSGFGSKDKFIILTDRIDKEDIIGYAWLNNEISDGQYWQVRDITIFPKYQKKGIGTNLYIKLAKEGYDLMNGFSLSTEIEKVWRKLPSYVHVYTWDKTNNQLSNMDERPKHDTQWDNEQNFFWVAIAKEEELKESNWHSLNDKWFNRFLLGEISPGFGTDLFEGTF